MATMMGIRDGIFHVGDRAYPWADMDSSEHESYPGQPWITRRVRLHFENGWTLSVVFGTGTYSDNHDAYRSWSTDEFSEEVACAEIGVWQRDGELRRWPDGDTVQGYVPGDRIAELIEDMKTWPTEGVELPRLRVDA